jgi:Zn-dependent protease with chaperone function
VPHIASKSIRALLPLMVLAMILPMIGCATAPAPQPAVTQRMPNQAEVEVLDRAVGPLVQELGYVVSPGPVGCKAGVTIFQWPGINAGITDGGRSVPCTYFTVGVTEGALQRLPVDMLRAMLAHEIGHVRLGHFEARKRRGEVAAILMPVARAFDREQEAEADRFAVELLRKLEPRYRGACMALVYVLAILAEERAGAQWLATHPSPDRRADTARVGCTR